MDEKITNKILYNKRESEISNAKSSFFGVLKTIVGYEI